jgi:excisionase family DNA binding protein
MQRNGTALSTDVHDKSQDPRPGQEGHLPTHGLLTVQDAAALLHVPISWVYEHTRRGAPDALPVVKVGKYVRFRPADLLEYIDRRSRAHTCR